MIKCDRVEFGRPIAVDQRDPRTQYVSTPGTQVYYDLRTGHIVIDGTAGVAVVVPPDGTVVRIADKVELIKVSKLGEPAEEKPVDPKQPASSDSPPPARPIQARGRVQR